MQEKFQLLQENLPESLMKKVGADIIEDTLYVNQVIRGVIFSKYQPGQDAPKKEKDFYTHKMIDSINYLQYNKKSPIHYTLANGDMCKFQKFNFRIAEVLKMKLYSPDMFVFLQSEMEDDPGLYFIMQGYCLVEIAASDSVWNNEFPLIKGEHFGEISLLYGC